MEQNPEQTEGIWNIEGVEVFFDDEDRKAVVGVRAIYAVRVSREDKDSEWEFFEESTPEDLRLAVIAALKAADEQVSAVEE